ncbi:MAG: caspase family protein [Pseudomonadota bacterium]
MRLALLLALCLLVPALLTASPALAERRLALVIGNDTYREVMPLRKAVSDAEAMAARLEETGFAVTTVIDATRRETNRALQRFAADVRPGDVVLLFYAGHGVEIGGQNYLLPVDIPNPEPGQEDFVRAESVALRDMLDQLRATPARVVLAFIDACRDNPLKRPGTRSIGASVGLGRIAAPEGSFVVFSAGAGQEALDGLSFEDAHPNSVFTRNLLPLMRRPGLDIRDLAVELRQRVATLAGTVSHRQTPAYYDELLGSFRFVAGAAPDLPEPDPIAVVAPETEASEAAGAADTPEPSAVARIDSDHAFAAEIGTAAAWAAFLDRHAAEAPEHPLVIEARDALAAAEAAEAPPPAPEPEDAAESAPPGDTAPARAATAPRTTPDDTPAELDETAWRRVQAALTVAGYDTRGIDGIFGPRTSAAIAAWQGDNLRPATGVLTAAESARLLAHGAGPWPPAAAQPEPQPEPATHRSRPPEPEPQPKQKPAQQAANTATKAPGAEPATPDAAPAEAPDAESQKAERTTDLAAPEPSAAEPSAAEPDSAPAPDPNRPVFQDTGTGRYLDANGCAREADGRIIFCP